MLIYFLLENAYFRGFYEEMADFIRSLFESALKMNPNLEFVVITGCLRISRESIFIGLNNLSVYSILTNQYADSFGFTEDEVSDVRFAEHFGFTDREVKELLEYYDLSDKLELFKEWYDGYRFGSCEIYNPWSILKFL